MASVYTFNKSVDERLEEYKEIFSNTQTENVKVREFEMIWSTLFDFVLEPTGWKAIWKIPRNECKKYKIKFPSIAIVYVDDIDVKLLQAKVEVLDAEDTMNDEFPKKLLVDLKQLYPTINQNESNVVDYAETARYLDIYRFFYNNLWMPWDKNEDETVETWVEKNLSNRLSLCDDMFNDRLPAKLKFHIQNKLLEIEHIKNHITAIDDELLDDVSEDELDDDNPKVTESSLNYLKFEHRLKIIEHFLVQFENKNIRQCLGSTYADAELEHERNPIVWLVHGNEPFNFTIFETFVEASKQILYFNYAEEFLTGDKISICRFEEVLDRAEAADLVIIQQGKYYLNKTLFLLGYRDFRGITSQNEPQTIICESEDLHCLLKLTQGVHLIQDITFEVTNCDNAVIISHGSASFKNCRFIAKTGAIDGVSVFTHEFVQFLDCKFSGFSNALVFNAKTTVAVERCEFENVDVAVNAHSSVDLKVKGCAFVKCQYGLQFATSDENLKMKFNAQKLKNNENTFKNIENDIVSFLDVDLDGIEPLKMDVSNVPDEIPT